MYPQSILMSGECISSVYIWPMCKFILIYMKKKQRIKHLGNFPRNLYFPNKYRKLEVYLLEIAMPLSKRQSIILHSIKVQQWFYHLASQWLM